MRTQITLGLLATLQLLVGLAGQLIVLRIVGIGWQTDAYIAAQVVPSILSAVVAASLQSLWLPRFGRAADSNLTWSTELGIAQGQTLKVMVLLMLPLWASSGVWVDFSFPGFSDSQRQLVVIASSPLFVAAGFNALVGLLTVAIRAKQHYFIAEAVSLAASLATLAGITIFVPRYGVIAAAWIVAARGILVFIILFFVAGRPTFHLRRTKEGREVAIQARPLISGGVFIKSGSLVDRYWGSQAAGGDITILSLAQLGVTSLATIIERAILTQALPSFAKRLKHGGPADLKEAYFKCLRLIFLSVLALSAGLFAIRPLWTLMCDQLLGLSPESSWKMWLICLILLPSLFVYVAGSAAVAVFYSFGETKVPTLIGILGFVVSITLKSFLFLHFGIIGIAIAISTYLMINMALYHVFLVRRLAPRVV